MLTDIFTPQKRSWIMSRIRSKNTKIDLAMKEILSDIGCQFQMYPKMEGNPDFIIKKKRIAIFCDGNFWHGYGYAGRKKPPKKFWAEKIEGNMRRDRRISRKLRTKGWSVLRFWEHDIERRPEACKKRIVRSLDKP
jgi:DNA mismatch endonuclease (patch repair protein)